jgi:hypothetical protein
MENEKKESYSLLGLLDDSIILFNATLEKVKAAQEQEQENGNPTKIVPTNAILK